MILAIEIDDVHKETFLKFCNEHNGKVLDEIDTEDLIWARSQNSENEEYLSEEESASVLQDLKSELNYSKNEKSNK